MQRVSGKPVSDYQEIFDGVPSQHDGKDAAIVLAEWVSHGKGSLWPYSTLSESQQILRHQVLRMDAYSKLQTQWLGRLEAMVARHWPELTYQDVIANAIVFGIKRNKLTWLCEPQWWIF